MNISSVGDAVLNDSFTVTGDDIPSDVVLEFSTAAGAASLPADFVRPHLVYVETLPGSLPAGDAELRLTSPSTNAASNAVNVTVTDGPPAAARLLHAGEAKPRPYTIAIVANPLLASRSPTLRFRHDPIITMPRSFFRHAVTLCLRGLFAGAEDVLTRDGIDARMRLVSVFSSPVCEGPSIPLREANCLIEQTPGEQGVLPRRGRLVHFLDNFPTAAGATRADVVIIINNSDTPNQSTSRPTDDAPSLGSVDYVFDNVVRKHAHFASTPGCASIHLSNLDPASPTVIHEFCHAASEVDDGWVADMDFHPHPPSPRFAVNLKHRAAPGDPVPQDFATYNGTTFKSNPVRFDGAPYPAQWTGYHAEPLDGRQHSLMDHWLDHPDRLRSRLDRLTHRWLSDRLNAKLSRPG
jgi:hypothetical protein